MGVFSRSLRVATNKKYFRTEFKKEFNKAERSRRLSFFLVSDECVKLICSFVISVMQSDIYSYSFLQKTLYFINLIALLSGLIYVTIRQSRGGYQCKSISVIIKEEVWEESIVRDPERDDEEMVLIYPFFNGMYNQDGTSHDGRPV